MLKKNWLFARGERVHCNAGDRWVDVLQPVVQDDGSVELEVVGKHCLYDEIQSHKDSCDINRILQRYANGDTSALNRYTPMWIDTDGMPKTYAEMLNVVIQGEKFFSELPKEVKESFDNNYYKFIASIGSEEFRSAFGVKEAAAAASNDVVQPVKEEE